MTPLTIYAQRPQVMLSAGLADMFAVVLLWGGGLVTVLALLVLGWTAGTIGRTTRRPPVLALVSVVIVSSALSLGGWFLGGG